jgi:DNA polymerase, archaea type
VTDTARDEWLWGWDQTPAIVSVHATPDGTALVWRRLAGSLTRETERFRPWLLLSHLRDLHHLGPRLGRADDTSASVRVRELDGPDPLRYLVSADDGHALISAVLHGASARLGVHLRHLYALDQLEPETIVSLPPEEQYLVATGRTYFKDLPFDDVHRLQFDLETTGLDARHDRMFMVSIRYHSGETEVLDARNDSDAAEADLIRRLVDRIRSADPDVIENHNLFGFDLPFLDRRARHLRVPLTLDRIGGTRLGLRAARRGVSVGGFDADSENGGSEQRRVRFVIPGRELIDTMDAVWRYDFATRELPGHGLKAVARHLGIAPPNREYIPGAEIYTTFRTDPERVRRYATDDVTEVAALSRMLGGAAYALARMAPRRYERLADAGPATGVIDPLLVRAYLRSGTALPPHQAGDGTPHSGAALYLFAAGVAHRVVKADVASLYPSLMRAYHIGSSRDRLGALLALVDRLVDRRLDAKARARAADPGSAERHTEEALSAALKIVVNSAYGYLAAGGLTRFADVHAANEVTRRGREVLRLICRELASRGVTLLEADTDGVYFAVPDSWTEADERRAVSEVAALLPPLVRLEIEGRYAAMLSHEPKNYALLGYDGRLTLRGVAFRSSRSEPFGDTFLRHAIRHLLTGDIAAVRNEYLSTIDALRTRALPNFAVSSRVRLTKSPDRYAASRAARRELPYEALLAAGREHWEVGDRIRVYRKPHGEAGLVSGGSSADDEPRDYDADYYVRLLRNTYAERLARAFTPDDFSTVFADPDQLALFPAPIESVHSVLTALRTSETVED